MPVLRRGIPTVESTTDPHIPHAKRQWIHEAEADGPSGKGNSEQTRTRLLFAFFFF